MEAMTYPDVEKLRARIVELERQRDLALDGEQSKAREIAALVSRVDTQSEMIECWSEYIDNLEAALRDTRAALDDLMDIQNGPPLITYTEAWNAAMDQARAVMERTAQPAATGEEP
jgi:chromosome segregation ATPase